MSIRALLCRETGLDLSAAAVDRAVATRLAALGVDDPDAYARHLSGDEITALTELLVVPESWMFRDPEAFATATRRVSELLLANPARCVRMLSVPCAGGEEPYSMAIALAEAGVPAGACRIDAIDLSAVALARAREGGFTRNAFRGGALAFRDRHFSYDGKQYQISDVLRERVSFRQGNILGLRTGPDTAPYDLIFCRNLLIYFDAPTTAAAIARLHALLADDGLLFAGYAEVPAFCANGFEATSDRGAFALRKAGKRAPKAGAPTRPAPASAPARTRVRPSAPAPVRRPAAAPRAADVPVLADLLAQARAQADRGDIGAAAASCHALLVLQPDCADAYFILGMASECEQHDDAAEGYWRRCVYLQPDHYEALCHLALLAERRGDAPQAASLRQRAARLFARSQPGRPARKAAP